MKRKNISRVSAEIWLFCVWLWICAPVLADWPAYKHDVHRSGVTDESLSFPLRPAWTYICPQPPAPAWPEPFRLLNRMDFDYAPALVITDGLVCFGSSADDTVRALDAKTGKEKWHFITGGPVRFAPAFASSTTLGATAGKPQIEKGKVYFASDDGFVYCLDAATGKLVWKFNAAPADERFAGNHRMISRWPIRTGVLVEGGVVYAVAGMWTMEGVFVYALAADTGKALWCNDTVGGTPQGALLLGGDVLLIPNGNGKTTPLDCRTGKVWRWRSDAPPGWVAGTYLNKQYMGGSPGRGGTWATIDSDKEYSFVIHRAGELAIEPYSLTNGLTERIWWGAGVVPQLSIEPSSRPNQIHERGKVSAIVHQGKLYARNAYGLALAGNTLLLGHNGAVTAQSATNANEIWRADVKGEARDLAVAAGRLFVSTSEGVIYAFAPGGGVDAASSPRALRDAESGDGKAESGKREVEKSEIRNLKSQIAEGGGQTPPAISHQPSTINHSPLPIPHQPSTINHSPSTISINHLHSSGMDRGFALVLGDADGRMSMALAAQTQLRVIVALSDESAVSALRERLLAQTTWHGSRIHVQHVERLDALPFPQYFANAVIVAANEDGRDGARPSTSGIVHGGPRSVVAGLSGKELYRVLRPCGGILLFPGLKATEAEALVKETGALESEIRAPPNTYHLTPITVPSVVRGKLPGALDWDNLWVGKQRNWGDQRVKWPLRLLWFGGPATRQMQNDSEGAPGPVVANGRCFTLSERALTAVDAYNGAILWSRPIPKLGSGVRDVDGVLYRVSDPTTARGHWRQARSLRVSDDNVYLTLEAAYFQGKSAGVIQLDAHMGEQRKIYGPFNPPTPVVSLKSAQTWPVEVNSNQSGSVAMESTARGLVLTLATQDSTVTPLDAWELFFDFRPIDERYGLYERGAFHIRVTASRNEKMPAAAWRLITGQDHPPLNVSGIREVTGTKTAITLPWPELEKWVGVKPASFDFAATLEAHSGGRDEPIVRRHLFGNWAADGINNGWARIVLNDLSRSQWDPASGGTSAPMAVASSAIPAIMASTNDKSSTGSGGAAGVLDKAALQAPGIHPLTGEPVPKIYGIAPVCGGDYSSATIISQAGGLYDLEENSGRRPCYPGVKTGCTTPQMAALGLFLISEEWGHCVCNYPFRGSLALAPAERRLNEDWAQFYDRDVDTRVRHAFVNLGAPGDRRDEKGNLWLKFPRDSELRRQEDYPSMHHPLPYPLGMRDAQVGLWPRRPIRSILWLPLEVDVITQATVAVSSQRALSNTKPRSRSAATVRSSVAALRERGSVSGSASFGPYRFNTDRVRIQGADRPWIYGSGYRGIRKATLKLDFFKPLVSMPAQTAPAIDGKLDEALWGDEWRSTNAAPSLPYTGTRVAFRHDAGHLYVGIKRPPMTVVKRTPTSGADAAFNYEPVPWRTTTNSGPDKISSGDNWWRLIVSDASAQKAVYLTVTPNGTRADALRESVSGGTNAATNVLNSAWNGSWKSAVAADTNGTNGMTLEMAIPWATLEEVGLKKDRLAVNFLMNDPGVGTESLTYLGLGGYDCCSNFTPLGLVKPASVPARAFTVKLHFAEPDEDVKAGQRVFDVLLQGQTVLKDFDVVREARAPRTALVKEFKSIKAAESLTLEFVPAAKGATPENAPILCGMEMAESDAGSANRY